MKNPSRRLSGGSYFRNISATDEAIQCEDGFPTRGGLKFTASPVRGNAVMLIGAMLLLISAITSLAAGWERIAPLPEPNGGFIAAAAGGRIVILGGTNWRDGTKCWLSRIHTFDPAANEWTEARPLAAPLAYAVVGSQMDGLWIAGGASGSGTHRSVWKLVDGATPVRVFDFPGGTALAGGGILGGKLYILGGTDDTDRLERATNALHELDIRDGRVTKLADHPEPAFFTGATAVCGGRLHAFGGAHWDTASAGVVNHASAHAFDPVTGRWEKLAPLPFAVRGMAACALDDTRLYLAGGYKNDTEEFTSEAFIFDMAAGAYRPAPPLPQRAMVALVKLGDWLYCLGGEDRKKHRSEAAFRIRWSELLEKGASR